MALIENTCSSCGAIASVAFGQRLLGGELRWSGRETCTSCGSIVEFDDYGDIPAELKPAILLDEGEWRLEIDADQDRLAALRVLRKKSDVSISAAKSMLDDLRGTKTTLQWLQEGLREVGVESSLSEVGVTAGTNDVAETEA